MESCPSRRPMLASDVLISANPPMSPDSSGELSPFDLSGDLGDICPGFPTDDGLDSSAGQNPEIAEQAKHEAEIENRIAELRKEGFWTPRRLSKFPEPSRPKVHWDYLCEEMQWLAADFGQERRWKRGVARKVVRMVVRHHEELKQKEERARREEQAKLRRIATTIAKEVRQFWSNVEKVVQFKQQSRLEEKRKKALDLQLDFIVGQTEKYSDLLSQSLSETIPVSKTSSSCVGSSQGGSLRTSPAPSICQKAADGDGDFLPHESEDEEEDDEATIEIEEQQEGNDAEAHRLELELLKRESELPLDELLQNLPPEVLQDDCPMQDPVSSEEGTEEEEEEQLEEEDDEFTANEDEAEDEEDTIAAEEEMAGQQDHAEELSLLAREGEMSLDELLLKYSVLPSEAESPSQSEQDSAGNQEEYGSSDCESEGVEFLLKLDAEEPVGDALEHEPPEPKKEITDIAATAESLQPKGYTLATTQVKTAVPFLLRGELREYQHIGLEWLVTMYEKKLNGILADEMGLGKTIQTISLLAHLACERGNWGPHLIIVPTSVILNWEMELKRWCPSFKILTYYGSQKERKLKRQGWTKANAFHVCITSYKLVLQDHQAFRRKNWKYLILDEAQNIKNFKSQRWQSLLNFNSQRRLLLTGTPLQNSLMELWSLMHFLMPHVFQSHREFKEWFSNPLTGMIEGSQEYNEGLVRRLHKVLRPFLLRRIKLDVEKQMPKKYEHVIYCRLSKRQRFLYDDFMSQAATRETLASGHFMSVINILMQLRKVCNHPNLFDPRPIHSPFITSGICYTVPSLVLHALQRHPLEHIDMSLFDLINMEGHVSRYERDVFLPHYKQSRPLIQEIAESPEPPPRPRPLKMKVNRMLQPVKSESRSVVVNNCRPMPKDVLPSSIPQPVAPPSLTPSPGPLTPALKAPLPVQSCPVTTSVTPVSNGAGKSVPVQNAQSVCAAPQRLILTPDMQARLPSGEVISLAQLAALGGRPIQSQSVTKPLTLQLQGTKLTLSGAPVRPLGVAHPRPVQGNVLHLVSSGGQHHLLSQPAQLALIQALAQQAASPVPPVPQLVQNSGQAQIGVQALSVQSLQHTLLNSTGLPAASPGHGPAPGLVKIVVRQSTREVPASPQRHPVVPPVRPLLRVVPGPSTEYSAAREAPGEQRAAPVVSTSTLTLTTSPLLMMSSPTLTARLPSPSPAQPSMEEAPGPPVSSVALRLLTTSGAVQLTNHHSPPPPRHTQSPALPNYSPTATHNPSLANCTSTQAAAPEMAPAALRLVHTPDGGGSPLDAQSVQNGNCTATDGALYVNLIPNSPSPPAPSIPKMAAATPTYNLSLVPALLANPSATTVSSAYPLPARFLTSPVSLLTLSALPSSNSGPSPVLYTSPSATSVSASIPLLAAPVSFTAPLPVSSNTHSSLSASLPETSFQPPRTVVSTQSPLLPVSGPGNLSAPTTALPIPVLSAPAPVGAPLPMQSTPTPVAAPAPAAARLPVLSAPAPAAARLPVLSAPAPVAARLPVLSAPAPVAAPAPAAARLPVLSAPAPAAARLPVLSAPAPVAARLPVLSAPASAAARLPVLSAPAPVAARLPVLSAPAPVAARLPVLSAQAPAATSLPVLSAPAPAAAPLPVLFAPAPAGTPLPVPSAPAPAATSLPVPSAPAPAAAPLPVPSAPAPAGTPLPVPSAPAPAGTSLPVPSALAPLGTSLPVPSAPAPAGTPLPVPSAPAPAGTSLPVPSALAPLGTSLPVPSAPAPAASSLPVPTAPAPAAARLPVMSAPAPAASSLPVPSAPAPAAARLPVPSAPAPAASSLPVPSAPTPAASSLPVLSAPAPAASFLPVRSAPTPAATSLPVLSAPAPAAAPLPVLSAPAPAAAPLPVRSAPAPAVAPLPVLSAPAPAASPLPVLSAPAPAASFLPVRSAPAPAATSLPVLSAPAPAVAPLPVLSAPAPAASPLPVRSAPAPAASPLPVRSAPAPAASPLPVRSAPAPAASPLPVLSAPAPAASPLPVLSAPAPAASPLPVLSAPAPAASPLPVLSAPAPAAAPLPVLSAPAPAASPLPVRSAPAPAAAPLPVRSAPAPAAAPAPTTLLTATAALLGAPGKQPLILASDSASVPLLEASPSDSVPPLVLHTSLPSVASSPMPLSSASGTVPLLAAAKVPVGTAPSAPSTSIAQSSHMLALSQTSLLAAAGSSCDPVSSPSILLPSPIALASLRGSAPATSLTFTTCGSVSSVASSQLSATYSPLSAVVTKITRVPSVAADAQAPLPAESQVTSPSALPADVASVQPVISGLSPSPLPCLSLRIPAPQPCMAPSTPAPMPSMPACTPASSLDPASLLLVPAPSSDLCPPPTDSTSLLPPPSASQPLLISFSASSPSSGVAAHSHIPLPPPQSSAEALRPAYSPKPVPITAAESSVSPAVLGADTNSTLPTSVSSHLPASAQEPFLSLSVADPSPVSVTFGSTAESDVTVEGDHLRPLHHDVVPTCVRLRRQLPPPPRSPFYLEPLEERRRKQKLERLERIFHLNERRSSLAPVYGTEVLRFCTVQPTGQQTDALGRCRFSAQQRLEQLSAIIERFIFAMPPVEAPQITLHTSHPPPSLVLEESVFKDRLSWELTPHTRCLHRIISNMRTQFPDLRLIQYDCGKLQTLDRLLRQLKSGGHRVLLFTQMTRMLDVLEQFLNYHGHIYLRLDGSTRVEQRQVLMERFNMDKRIFCFILSTRSGGVGVNLTGADTVIFYDSDWNPTMDAQAQDRCHRIGQTRDVHIYRLVSERTVEENILKKAQQKRLLGDMAIEGGNFTTAYFKQQTIRELFDMEDMPRKEAEVRNASPDHSTEDGATSRQEHILEQALCGAEDEEDTLAASLVRAEQVADLAEFNENVPLDPEEEEPSRAEQEISALVEQLTPIERYAMYYLEASLEEISKEELKQAEEQVEAARKDLFLAKDEVGLMAEEKWDEETRRNRKVKTPVPSRPTERVGVRMSERLRGSRPAESVDQTESPAIAPPSLEKESMYSSLSPTQSNQTAPEPDAACPCPETTVIQSPTMDPLSTTLPPSGFTEEDTIPGNKPEKEDTEVLVTENVADTGVRSVPGSPVRSVPGSPVRSVPGSPVRSVPEAAPPRRKVYADCEITLAGATEASPTAKVLRRLPGRLVTLVQERLPTPRRQNKGRVHQSGTENDCQSPDMPGPHSPFHDRLSEETSETGSPPPKRKRGRPRKAGADISPVSIPIDVPPVDSTFHISTDLGTSQGGPMDLATRSVIVQTPGSPNSSFKVNSDSESGSPIEKRKRGRPPKRREGSPIVATPLSPKRLEQPPFVASLASPKAHEEHSFVASLLSSKKCEEQFEVTPPKSYCRDSAQDIQELDTKQANRTSLSALRIPDHKQNESSGPSADSIIPVVSSNIPMVPTDGTSSSGVEEPVSPPKRKRGRPPKSRPVFKVHSSPMLLNDVLDSSPERSPSPQVTRTSLQRKCKPLMAETLEMKEQNSSLADTNDSSDEEVTVRLPLTRSARTKLPTTSQMPPAVLQTSAVSSKSPRGRSPRPAAAQEKLPTKKRKPPSVSSPSPSSSSPHGSSSESKKRPCPPAERVLRSSLTANPASNTRSSRSPLLNSPNSHRGRKAKT